MSTPSGPSSGSSSRIFARLCSLLPSFLLAACPRILLRKPETSFSFSLSVAASPQKAEWTALE